MHPEVSVGARAIGARSKLVLELEEVVLQVVLERRHLFLVTLSPPGASERPIEILKCIDLR
jgi:hypothetical protein